MDWLRGRFQSTHSKQSETWPTSLLILKGWPFQSTHSKQSETRLKQDWRHEAEYFNPLTLNRVRHAIFLQNNDIKIFQSTHSKQSETNYSWLEVPAKLFQSTHSKQSETSNLRNRHGVLRYFNPLTLNRVRRSCTDVRFPFLCISIHSL